MLLPPFCAAPAQVVEGRDGGKLPGFEAYFKSTVHASPLMYDIDFDGIQDILVATYDGEILFFKDTVSCLRDSWGYPRESRRFWWPLTMARSCFSRTR